MEGGMSANWLKEQLETARKEIRKWPDWKKRELAAETEQIPKKGDGASDRSIEKQC
jgi:hypothetical protein